MGVETGVQFGREGGSASIRETPAVNKERPGVFRGPEDGRQVFVVLEAEDGRQVFVVLEAAPRKLGSGGGSGGKRAESGGDA